MVRICACARVRVHVSLELPDGLVGVVAAVPGVVRRSHGRPDIRGAGIAESRRRHADDLHRVAVDRDRLADRGLNGAELRHCPVIRHDSDGRLRVVRRNIALRQQASRRRGLAEDRKEISRDVPGVGKHGAVAEENGCVSVAERHRHLLEHVVLRLPVEKVGA